MRKLFVIADGGPRIGFGHLKRQADLINALQARAGWRACLATTESSPEAVTFFRELCPETDHLALPGVEGLGRAIEQAKPDLVVVDVLNGRFEACGAAASACGAVSLAVGDWSQPHPTRTAMLLNANPREVERKRAFYEAAGVEALLGPGYFMASAALRQAPGARSPRSGVLEVLVALGGGDRTDALARILEALRPITASRGLRVRVLISPVSAFTPDPASAENGTVEFLQAVRDVRPLLQSADLLIASHGNIAYESAVLGVPMIAVNLVACQQEQAEEMERLGAVVNAGPGESLESEPFRHLVERLLDDGPGRKAMATRRRELVDGRGLERLMDALDRRWEQVTSGEGA